MRKGSILLFLALSFFSCAIQVPPEGGDKDALPPVILRCEPANYSTNVKPSNIKITFDEFGILKDISNQFVSSPLLATMPETKIKKKSLFIYIADTLKENTTYTLNFGNAISDNNEGNSIENYQYVFSTGDVIDSLLIQGKVEMAFNHKTEKNVVVMLYNRYEDSIPYLERPLYTARTKENGEFEINNISPGNYKLVCLKEVDANYIYSVSGESIGFSSDPVVAGASNLHYVIFEEPPALRYSKSISEFAGKVNLVFTTASDTLKLNWLSDTLAMQIYSLNFSPQKDTLTIWYKNLQTDSISFTWLNGKSADTVTTRLFKNDPEKKERKQTLSVSSATRLEFPQNLFEPFVFYANRPVVKINSTLVNLIIDSVPEQKYSLVIDTFTSQKVIMDFVRKPNSKFSIVALPGAFEDYLGFTNDTTVFSFSFHPESDYGSLVVNYLNAGENNMMQLVADNDVVIRECKVSGAGSASFINIYPGSYRVKMIVDGNHNGKWDTGVYLRKLQPEETRYYPESITVRANWDVDVKWDLLTNVKKDAIPK